MVWCCKAPLIQPSRTVLDNTPVTLSHHYLCHVPFDVSLFAQMALADAGRLLFLA